MSDIDLMIEECSELIQACCKYKRSLQGDKTLRCSRFTVTNMMREEIVDVNIVLSRLIDEFFKDNNEYNNMLAVKLDRTARLSN